MIGILFFSTEEDRGGYIAFLMKGPFNKYVTVEGRIGGRDKPLRQFRGGGSGLNRHAMEDIRFLPLYHRNFNACPINSFKIASKYPNVITVVSPCTYIIDIYLYLFAFESPRRIKLFKVPHFYLK